jgi:hypothetical protein
MASPVERAALKDLMQNINTTSTSVSQFQQYPSYYGTSAVITPEDFVADDSLDPCSNNGQGKRLMFATCIGGHVSSLYFDPFHAPLFTGFPRTTAALQHLRHIRGAGRNEPAVTFPCELGKLANLKALVWGDLITAGSGSLLFPEDDSCMDGLAADSYGAYCVLSCT